MKPPTPLAAALAALFLAPPATAQVPGVSPRCSSRPPAFGGTGDPASAGDFDLFCIDLFGTASAPEASGVVELVPPWSPFGVSVTPEGRHRHGLIAHVDGLPDPGSLGPYTTFVAWATPLVLDPVLKLGPVRDGENRIGEVSFNKYMILVTAEASADVTERSGPLVLRGRSPSSRMEAHDLMTLAPAAEEVGRFQPEHAHADAWRMPPMYEGVPMLPGVSRVRPRSAPHLPTPPRAAPEALPRTVVELPDGGTLDLTAGFVRRRVGDREITMLAFNGQHPGPLIRVAARSTIFVNFTNDTPYPTAVHWHGIRLDNRFDGVPGVTQDPVAPGRSFQYRIHFPDAGIYWYHPHHREDVQQELGLAGNLLVDPSEVDYYNPVDREEVVMLDDLLLGDEDLVPFGEGSANYMLMGRFGNVFLTNGEPEYSLAIRTGEVVRFFFTNAANTRTFNLSFRRASAPDAPPLPVKVVGSDVSRFEREVMAQSVVLAPAERYVVEVLFPDSGRYDLVNQVQGINHRMGVFLEERSVLGAVTATGPRSERSRSGAFALLRTHEDVVADIDRYRANFERPPDRELVLTLEVDSLPLPVEQSMRFDRIYFNPVEWTGTMPVMNWSTTGSEVAWILRDPATGAENTDIAWRFRVGDVVKIRLRNDRGAFHAMQHPLHIHGQRFLVLSRNGVPNPNLVWKDTVVLPTGSTTDILLELSNPGRWMVHCHIAEHLESGMKLVIQVDPA